jgi:thymidylate kinase
MDAIVDPRRYRYGGPAWLLRAASRISPQPDLVILLDVPPDDLLARKAEMTRAEAERQGESYNRLVSGLRRGRSIRGGSADDVAAQVERLILAQVRPTATPQGAQES